MNIYTKELRDGTWSCYATIEGYDYSFLGDSINDSRLKMLKHLKPTQLIITNWVIPKPYIYIHKPILPKPPVTYARNRIDNL